MVEAARRIFARDGFELARLEDIAAEAGKTRGAFYANFDDKEDVFFAIFEEDVDADRALFEREGWGEMPVEQRFERLVHLVCALLENRRRMLLGLEFKMYAVRHPHRQRRLARLHAAMCLRCAVGDVEQLLSISGQTLESERRTQLAQFGALVDGLALQRLFDPAGLTREQVERQVRASLRVALTM